MNKTLLLLSLFSAISFVASPQSWHQLIDAPLELEVVADTFQFTEGPASDLKGNIYFTDILTSRIYLLSISGELSIFREPSGRANGLKVDRKGNLLICEGAARQVSLTSPQGEISVLAGCFENKKLNSPNDLWIDPKGGIYFTDPRYDAKWIWVEKDDPNLLNADSLYVEKQDFRALYYLSPDRRSLCRVAKGFMNPNGVTGTLDSKKLYVSDTKKKEIYIFDILDDGSLTNRKVFIPEYSDGMTLDENNNLYITNGGVQIYTPNGKLITTIELPYQSSNVCFGGKERKTLFITARQAVFSLRMKVTGQ